MPTISTEGTPASTDSFETGEDVSSETCVRLNQNAHDPVDSIQNLNLRAMSTTGCDLDLDGLNDANRRPVIDLPATATASADERIKLTTSQAERVEVSNKLEHIVERDIFQTLDDASSEDVAYKPAELRVEADAPWVDVIGSGDIMKKVVVSGLKHTRPHRGQVVTVNLKGQLDDDDDEELVECFEDFSFTLGDAEVVQGLELAIPLMDKKETANILVKARFAYGELGREPDIPSNSNIKYTIELIEVFDEPTVESLSICERMRIGSGKKDRGNFWFTRGDFSQAIVCYRRALEFLDDENSVISDGSLQQLLEDRLKVYNNLALAQLKVDAFDAAIISVDNVIRIQPDNVKALFRKGKILAAQGNTDEAIACMRRALKLEPDTKIIQAELARLQSQKTQENASERELYRKMLGEQRHLVRSKRSSKFKVWGSLLGGLAAVVVGIIAYRQYHALGRELNLILNSPFIEMLKEKVTVLINTVAGKLEQEHVEPTVIPQTATVESPTPTL